MEISRVGVDLAKNVFQLHGADSKGKTVWKRQLSRDKWLKVIFASVKPGAVISMESCTRAHHWSRILISIRWVMLNNIVKAETWQQPLV